MPQELVVLEASMLVIGDELLAGHVTDANSPWLADRLRVHGVPLRSIHVVADTAEDIDTALQLELGRARPRVIVTSGGIGSTPDDLTYEAVAASLGLELEEHPLLADRIAGALTWSREQGFDVTDEYAWYLGRMARIPAGGRVLTREGGWATAVAVDVDGGSDDGGATVVILPGVPSEFRALVEHTVEPALLADRNPVPVTTELEHHFPESVLNPTFAALGRRFPDVKLGSYPGRPMLVRLTGSQDDVAGASALVRAALDELDASPAGQRLAAAWNRRDPEHDEETDA